jgi:UDP-N-acetylmuramate dehydrogenase
MVLVAPTGVHTLDMERLRQALGSRLQVQVPLARFTAARVGGPADALVEVATSEELANTVQVLWKLEQPFIIVGGGSNMLVSDAGVRQVVLINRCRPGAGFRFEDKPSRPMVWAEAGVNFGALARQAAQRGLSGLEWAAGIPGTVGGAVVGNAGAHGSDMAGCLVVAEILHRQGQEHWPVEHFAYSYRSSLIKRGLEEAIVLNATLRLEHSTPQTVQERMDIYMAHRRQTQPAGASMGSMFKNPPGDYAGRLIEAAGLKGVRIGEAEISRLHANFFVNLGKARAADIAQLIQLARREVAEKFGIELELEIEMIGDWEE